MKMRAFFCMLHTSGGMRIPDRGSTTGDSQLDRLRAKRTGCPQGERSESIPPSPPSLKKSSHENAGFFLHVAHLWGDENPRPGFDNWRQPVGQTESEANRLPAGRAKRVNPPLTAIFEMRARTKVRAFFFWIAPGDSNLETPCALYAWWRCAYQAYGYCRSGKRSATRHHARTKNKARFPGP